MNSYQWLILLVNIPMTKALRKWQQYSIVSSNLGGSGTSQANSLIEAIKSASDKGWLTAPKDTGIPDVVESGNNVCDKDINHGAIGPYQIQAQVGRVRTLPFLFIGKIDRLVGST